MAELTVFGGGSWGTALAASAAASGHSVCLWCRRSEQARAISATGKNPDYLRDIPLPAGVSATSGIEEAALFSHYWILALPTQTLREFLPGLGAYCTGRTEICNVAKGIEIDTGKRISEIVREILPVGLYSVLSGPSFAEEVARGLPTAVTVASGNEGSALFWQSLLNTSRLRIYTSHDVAGTETGGAVKNIMAIASGLASSLGLGDNARAALVSRGLAEIMRFGEAIGAHPLTLAGLAGMGDLVLTCYSTQSRNFRLGMALGRGLSLEEARKEIGQVAEGAYTVRAVTEAAASLSVDMPISRGVHRLLYEGASPAEELERLLTRDPKAEYPPAILWGSSSCPEKESGV
ncbi:NAD(P)H-dependent glycerol-3-phosphate dehydrogenase [Aminivibrio sp.]|jgi:glycerol-3-phosphate dehydrogenase (NAD(P)+)|uniref:NAD(P)H-dependent glycerol-3-phosphate dehydrogenase n=1 Tax=Aminivibrio sp. TaxID=1872489 RepID=UPI00345F10FE